LNYFLLFCSDFCKRSIVGSSPDLGTFNGSPGAGLGYQSTVGYFPDRNGLTYSLLGNRDTDLGDAIDPANPQENSFDPIVKTVTDEIFKPNP
jgi:hypothetical protein